MTRWAGKFTPQASVDVAIKICNHSKLRCDGMMRVLHQKPGSFQRMNYLLFRESVTDLYFLVDKQFFHSFPVSLMEAGMMKADTKCQS